MQKESLKFQDSTVFEGMTSIRAILSGIDRGVNDRQIETILFDGLKRTKNIKEIGYLTAVSGKYHYTIKETTAEELEKITLGTSHGGIVAIAKDRTIYPLGNPPEDAVKPKENGFYAMIQGIEDPYNFGYSLRSLYACGCDGIILPERNWYSAAGVVCRSSAGASELFPVYSSEPADAVSFFHALGYQVVCADERTDDLLGFCELKLPLLLIVGGEKRGISRELLDLCDRKVKIPYARDFHASLSAASAITMFSYEIMRQNQR